MKHPRTYDALILLTRDIGEADRLCILFTREMGRKIARARAVRKTGSRLGGILLPLRRVQLEIREHGGVNFISAAVAMDAPIHDWSDVPAFARMNQGIELLLRLTEDDEPLPAVFDLLLDLRDACSKGRPDPVLPFQLRLLHFLGFLPITIDDPRFAKLSHVDQDYVRSCADSSTLKDLCELPGDRRKLRAFCDALLAEQLDRPLNAGKVSEALLTTSVSS